MKKGFTTIELVIMITILAILMVLIVPNFLTYLDNASKSEYSAAKQTLETATENYVEDHGGFENFEDNDPATTGNVKKVNISTELKADDYIDQKTIDSIRKYAASGLAGAAVGETNEDYNQFVCVDVLTKKVEYKIELDTCP